MAIVVVDASVVVKWLVPEREEEADVERALQLLAEIRSDQIGMRQPPHWLAEAAAVAARLGPATAEEKILMLYALQCPIVDRPGVYTTACALSIELDHHLFDTLYHAVALELADATLVTADERYYEKAKTRGGIVRLMEFELAW